MVTRKRKYGYSSKDTSKYLNKTAKKRIRRGTFKRMTYRERRQALNEYQPSKTGYGTGRLFKEKLHPRQKRAHSYKIRWTPVQKYERRIIHRIK